MRFEFSPRAATAHLGEQTISIRPARSLLRTKYRWTWLDGSRMELQATSNLQISLLRNDVVVCTATLHRPFLDWKSRGYLWVFQGEEYAYRLLRRLTSLEGLRKESTRNLLAVWAIQSCRTVGVLSPALSADDSRMAFGMIVANLLILKQS